MNSGVVLIDVFSYSCMNCLRSLNHIKKLHYAYGKCGLKTVLLHPPEWEFEKNKNNILNALKEYRTSLPIMIDKNKKMVKKYGIGFWPAQVLLKNGNVIYRHVGEGSYKNLESSIAKALGIKNKGVYGVEPRYSRHPCVYAGYGKKGIVKRNSSKMEFGVVYADGIFRQMKECIRMVDCSIRIIPRKGIVGIVAKSKNSSVAGISVGKSHAKIAKIIKISRPRLYEIAKIEKVAPISIKAKNIDVYSFSFR